MSTVQSQLNKGGDDKSLSVSVLKEYLKSKNMVASGDKHLLWTRCKLSHKIETNNLKTEDGENPTILKPAQLRKANAKVGLSPIGSNDELLFAYVEYLMKNNPNSNTSSVESSSSSSSSDSSSDNDIIMAKKVLDMMDEVLVNPIHILQLYDKTLSSSSSTSLLRKAYLKMSLLIHPDRIGRKFEQATKAFQILVSAFEHLTEPELINEITNNQNQNGKNVGKKNNRISRSNEGCYKTKIYCPRCKQEWTTGKIDGNPDYYYNIFMNGLKSFTCTTCLCLFGCMTAIHKCPFCHEVYEYHPKDYHRKVNCGNQKCINKKNGNQNNLFGFYEYYFSIRNENILKDEIKKTRSERNKLIETAKRRNKSALRRNGLNKDHDELQKIKEKQKEDEAAFVNRLVDICPRCGLSFLENSDEDAQRNHLKQCQDTVAIKRYSKVKEKEAIALQEKVKKSEKQDDTEALAAWQFLGAKSEQLWLLSEDQLMKQCEEKGVKNLPLLKQEKDSKEDLKSSHQKKKQRNHENEEDDDEDDRKDKLISALVNRNHSTDLITSNSNSSHKRSRLSLDTLPDNWTSLPLKQLKSILSCYGFIPKHKTKDKIISEVEAELCGENNNDEEDDESEIIQTANKNQKLLTSSSSAREKKKVKTTKNKVTIEIISSEESDGGDSEFELEE